MKEDKPSHRSGVSAERRNLPLRPENEFVAPIALHEASFGEATFLSPHPVLACGDKNVATPRFVAAKCGSQLPLAAEGRKTWRLAGASVPARRSTEQPSGDGTTLALNQEGRRSAETPRRRQDDALFPFNVLTI